MPMVHCLLSRSTRRWETVPSLGRNVRVAAAGVGALALTVVVAYFQLYPDCDVRFQGFRT